MSFDQAHHLDALGNMGTQLTQFERQEKKERELEKKSKEDPTTLVRGALRMAIDIPKDHDISNVACNWEALQAKAKVQAAQVGFVKSFLEGANWMQIRRYQKDHDAKC